jgi:hypothetical protein
MLLISLYICTCPSLVPERLDGLYSYSVFKTSSVMCRCPVNVNIVAPEEEGPLDGARERKIVIFSKMSLTAQPDIQEYDVADSCPYQTTRHNNLETRISIFGKSNCNEALISTSLLQEQNFVNLEHVMSSGSLMLQLEKFIYLRRCADKSLAFPITYFPICSTTKRIFLGWVKEVRTTMP